MTTILPDTSADGLVTRVRDLAAQLGYPPPVGRVMAEYGVERSEALAAIAKAAADVDPVPDPPAAALARTSTSTSRSTTPRWVRVVTISAVSVVAAVAAIASYVHMHELATRAGEEWRAWLIPLSADGLLVAASMVMFVRRRAGERAGLLPWLGLVFGLTASLAANVAVAQPDPVSLIVSAWPPIALAISFELLVMVSRADEPQR